MKFDLRRRLLATTLISAAFVATPAWAQVQDDDVQENAASSTADPTEGDAMANQSADDEGVIITGSRIQRRDLTSTSPLAVIQDEEFKLSGAVNVEQVLNTLPQVIPGATSFSNNPGGGVATVDLRGLGATRTLVLVNGRRYIFFDPSQLVDLNTIPQFLIDSVDVVTGGASAVYGSDALSGVVNFRLQTDLKGFMAGGQVNITEEGDGRRLNAYVAVGSEFADNRGYVTTFAEYFKRRPIFQGARGFSRFALGDSDTGSAGGELVPVGSATTPQGRFSVAATQAIAGFDANRDGDFTDAGDITPAALARGAGNFRTAFGANFASPGVSDIFDFPGETYNYAPANFLQVPQERWLLGGYGAYEISDAVTAFTEVTFINNRVQNELAATPVTGTFNFNVAQQQPFLSAADFAALQQIDANETAINAERARRLALCRAAAGTAAQCNAFLPLFGVAAAPGVAAVSTFRRVLETGPRNSFDDRNAFRVLAGVKGPVIGDFNYEAYYSFARTRNANIQEGNISRTAFQRGLDGTGTPINIFGPGTLTPAAVDSITILAQNNDISTLQVAAASIAGSLGNLGMGGEDLGLAVGTEYRKVSSRFIPDTALSSGDVIGFNAGDSTGGGYDVKEVFAELRVPLLADRPFFNRLTLTGAARYSDYSLENVGGVYTYAGGVEFAPIRDITFRGQYQRAVRAPNVQELFGGQSNGFPGATDPCSARNTANQTDVVRQLCIQTGVPAALVFTAGVQPNNQIEGVFGGNPDLQEESGDTYTVGAIIRPSFLPRLNIAIDGYDITIDDTISTFGGGLNNTLNLCFNTIQSFSSPFCQAVTRDPNTGIIGGQFAPRILNANIGTLETRGVDLQVDYSLPLGFGMLGESSKLNFFFLGTYVDKFDITPVADLPDVVNECAGRYGTGCGNPTPRYRWSSRLSFIDGPLSTSVRWRHVGATRQTEDDDFVVARIGTYDLIDLTFSVDVNDGLSLTAGVQNLFDKNPPIAGDASEQANTFPGLFDVLGRDYFVSASVRF